MKGKNKIWYKFWQAYYWVVLRLKVFVDKLWEV